MAESKLGLALVKELCPICTKEYDGPIYMNTRLTESTAKKVEEIHGKVVGFMEEPCKDCKELYKGKVAFIECRDESDDYRTGLVVGIADKAVIYILQSSAFCNKVLDSRSTYISKSNLELILGDLYPKDEE